MCDDTSRGLRFCGLILKPDFVGLRERPEDGVLLDNAHVTIS